MNRKELFSAILTETRECLNSDEFLNEFRLPKHFVRKRKLSLKQMVYYLIFNCRKTIDLAMDEFTRAFPEVCFPEVTKQAISKGRAGIDHRLFMTIFSDAVENYYRLVQVRKLWRENTIFSR